METKMIELKMPLAVYDDLKLIADSCSWTLEEVVLRTIQSGMPPTLGKIPEVFHKELLALNQLSDKDLMRIVDGEFPAPAKQDEQHRKADFDSLRQTYAQKLLKWRGHPVLSPYEY